ncbi:MAG: LamG domain-containing protein, partial [Gammaproteobacteria bacterium]|nr:LamG domain-containing protein [Gammaproteobacteria bacterium]
ANQWYHIHCSHDSGTTKLYIDGVEQSGALDAGGSNGAANVLYGYNPNGQCLVGLMDDVRKHDRVLTQAEITHLATSRGIEGGPDTPPPTTGFYNPFISYIFHTLSGQRIR